MFLFSKTVIPSIVSLGVILSTVFAQALNPDLEGTWSTKSNKTFTGPGFYDPINEKFIEPEHTGISYSFTKDGFYESAYYRAIANPANPACPKGIMQWQHGSYQKHSNGSLTLWPIEVDGRQLYSDPCKSKHGQYTRYNQSELFNRYEVFIDPYHNIFRLNLFRFDNSPMNSMYLAYRPPVLLPSITLNPTVAPAAVTPTTVAASTIPTINNNLPKRSENNDFQAPQSPKDQKQGFISRDKKFKLWNPDNTWILGLAMTSFGGFLFFL